MTRVVSQSSLYPDNWPQVSKRAKTRADWRCESCRKPHIPGMIHIETHHIDGNPRNCDDDNLIVLCKGCHDKAGGMIPRPMTRLEVLQRLAQQGRQLYFK